MPQIHVPYELHSLLNHSLKSNYWLIIAHLVHLRLQPKLNSMECINPLTATISVALFTIACDRSFLGIYTNKSPIAQLSWQLDNFFRSMHLDRSGLLQVNLCSIKYPVQVVSDFIQCWFFSKVNSPIVLLNLIIHIIMIFMNSFLAGFLPLVVFITSFLLLLQSLRSSAFPLFSSFTHIHC